MLKKALLFFVFLLLYPAINSSANNILELDGVTVYVGEGMYTSQPDPNILFGFNGGLEPEVDIHFRITSNLKLRVGVSLIKGDMWTQFPDSGRVDTVIYPFSSTLLIHYQDKTKDLKKVNYIGLGLTYYPAKIILKERTIGNTGGLEVLEREIKLNRFGTHFLLGFESLISSNVTWTGEIVLRSAQFQFDDKKFTLDGIVFKVGLGYHFGERK